MANCKQLPLMRGSAQKAFEENRISLQKYNEVLSSIQVLEKHKSIVADVKVKSISGQMLMKRNNIMHHESIGLRMKGVAIETSKFKQK